jgi:nickel transport protein
LVIAVTSPAMARPHRLDVQAFLLPGQNKVQIESWFDDGHIPRGARVQIFRNGNELLANGQLDDNGVFIFSYTQAETLKVVVSAGLGHRKEIDITTTDLISTPAAQPNPPDAPGHVVGDTIAPVRLADHHSTDWVKDVMIGVSFLLALAAFLLGTRNARLLRALKQPNQKSIP